MVKHRIKSQQDRQKYVLSARLIHWVMAAGFVFMWGCGYSMTTLVADDSPLEELLFDLHISVGVTLLALLCIRIVIRIANLPPALPSELSRLERIGAKIGHKALYWLPAIIIALGWAETNFGGHTVQWFSLAMPTLFPETGENLQKLAETLHMWFAYTMLAVAVVHVGAALKHRWVDGHDVLYRMTIGRK